MASSPGQLAFNRDVQLLLPYVTDLEFEVDRLRKQGRFVEEQVWLTIKALQHLSRPADDSHATTDLAAMRAQIGQLAGVMSDLRQQSGYHPSYDQVVAIAVRPLIEQVFRWQQRLENAERAELIMELEVEYVDWFPARLRHIIDSLLANALRHGAIEKGEARVTVGLRRMEKGYELRITDNGLGLSAESRLDMQDLLYRAAPARAAGTGVGLSVVKMLIQQSGGSLSLQSEPGRGACFLAILPRYDIDDYLETNSPAAN